MLLPPTPKKPDPLERLLAQPAFEGVPLSLVEHAQAVPLGILVRGTLEGLLDEPTLEQLFQQQAPEQYTRELTMSALVGLLIQVSAGLRASVYAAYKADQATAEPTIATSYQALYGKLGRMEPAVGEALVRHSAEKLKGLLQGMPTASAEPLPGYRVRVLDGNVLTGTDHRLKALRRWLNACLPGKSLVVYEPALGLVTDLVLCEDAYTQERALLVHVVDRLQANDLVVADRNFCTRRFVFGCADKQAFFVVRQHRRNVPCEALSKLQKRGQTPTGLVYEQSVRVTDPHSGKQQVLRRIEIRLFDKTRDGERTIALLTNLPDEITAVQIAALYQQRWTIETQFQFLTQALHCEVPGLGQPRAALFLFAMSLLASNALAVVRGALRQAHGLTVEKEISGYYLADEIAFDYRTLMKYLPPDQWTAWRSLPAKPLTQLLIALAGKVNVKALTRSQRGPKKTPVVKPVYNKKHKHYSTARLLSEAEDTC
jgi:Transposase DDE domain